MTAPAPICPCPKPPPTCTCSPPIRAASTCTPACRRLFFGCHVHGHDQRVLSTSQHDAPERADVAEVAAPRDGDVTFTGEDRVGGIEVDPAERGQEGGGPGVRSISANQLLASRRRLGL